MLILSDFRNVSNQKVALLSAAPRIMVWFVAGSPPWLWRMWMFTRPKS